MTGFINELKGLTSKDYSHINVKKLQEQTAKIFSPNEYSKFSEIMSDYMKNGGLTINSMKKIEALRANVSVNKTNNIANLVKETYFTEKETKSVTK